MIFKSTNVTFCTLALTLTVLEKLTLEIFELEKKVRSVYKIRNDAIRLQMLTSIKVISLAVLR